MSRWAVTSFYAFANFPDCGLWKTRLLEQGKSEGLFGTILLAPEGVNGTITGPTRDSVNYILDSLKVQFPNLTINESEAPSKPFQKWLVKVKKEIITIRESNANPLEKTAKHVSPEEWNKLLQTRDLILLDTRNDYEVECGSFEGAIDPHLTSFGQFPEFVKTLEGQEDKPVAMFCTGGIRCEKAGAYMLAQGFKKVYQLEGGILTYLKETPPEQSKFKGSCFVFDERRAID